MQSYCIWQMHFFKIRHILITYTNTNTTKTQQPKGRNIMAMTSAGREFRFFHKTGEYNNREANVRKGFRKASATDRNNLRGKVCPGCGTTRSMTNKCECNS